MNFRIRGLEARQFNHLFALSDAELAQHGAVRQIADAPRPCRISLSDAKPGDDASGAHRLPPKRSSESRRNNFNALSVIFGGIAARH